jgi:hypothetical protein
VLLDPGVARSFGRETGHLPSVCKSNACIAAVRIELGVVAHSYLLSVAPALGRRIDLLADQFAGLTAYKRMAENVRRHHFGREKHCLARLIRFKNPAARAVSVPVIARLLCRAESAEGLHLGLFG